MPFVFDPVAIIASRGPKTLGEQFESYRRHAVLSLERVVEFRPYYEAHNDESESRDLSKCPPCGRLRFPLNTSIVNITDDSFEFAAAKFDVSQDDLRFELESMRTLFPRIQYANWPYRQFPYLPKCLLYMCADSNPVSKIVWGTTQNAALYAGSPRLRLKLLVGLGLSSLWSFTRACKMGIIIWCRFSLYALIKKFEADRLDKRDVHALESFEWRMLWFVNIMHSNSI
ncbi:uncharacterized protein EAE97_010894 [Botrytis byssoidea]|uniref:Uncharacterized protein n=1 Tax=Botrytis byssoidea TaxID=139641 RepID=A0A9P5I0T4_9HELO|nr:uncharacterized protein EAE97_010894 [Botrytis byssoidea]KAF7923456.1 hypothetical protein EAE97_010894 [Botrytis byssoidea]